MRYLGTPVSVFVWETILILKQPKYWQWEIAIFRFGEIFQFIASQSSRIWFSFFIIFSHNLKPQYCSICRQSFTNTPKYAVFWAIDEFLLNIFRLGKIFLSCLILKLVLKNLQCFNAGAPHHLKSQFCANRRQIFTSTALSTVFCRSFEPLLEIFRLSQTVPIRLFLKLLLKNPR